MKRILSIIVLAGIVGALVSGCNKNTDLKLYTNDPAIYFYQGTNSVSMDSSSFNFVLLPVNQTVDTVYVSLRIMGFPADKDRVVNVRVNDSTTAQQGVQFKVGPAVVHAGNYVDSFPVYVYRTADMADSTFNVYLNVDTSADFKLGYQEYLWYVLSITDRVVPPNWSYTFSSTFGAYSNVKFRFMVSVLQVTTFSGLLPSQAAAMATKCKLALAEYETANGPLMDENGQRVVFP